MRKIPRVFAVISLIYLADGCRTGDGAAEVKDTGHSHQAPADAPSTHGMLVVGNGPVYLSHLPMFHKPHDYQALFEVDFVKTGGDPVAEYAQDRHLTGEKVYTIVPEVFSLPELFGPVGTAPQRTSFKATLYRGHFERGGSPIIANLTVKVKRVVLAKKFEANPTALPQLKYFLFGDADELFAAHVVNKLPDFDHVESVKLTSGVPSDAAAQLIHAGAYIDFTGVPNLPAQALKEAQDYNGQVKAGVETLTVKLHVDEDFYLETGDLSF